MLIAELDACVPIRGEDRYTAVNVVGQFDPLKPLYVTLRFYQFGGHTDWLISRELLHRAIVDVGEEIGAGDVSMCRDEERPDILQMRLSSPDGAAVVHFDWNKFSAFLQAAENCAPHTTVPRMIAVATDMFLSNLGLTPREVQHPRGR